MVFNKKGQGALEYLLMIVAAILIVAVVIVILSGIVVDTKDQNTTSDYNSQMDKLNDLKKNPITKDDSSVARITSFSLNGVNGVIEDNTIRVTLPQETDLSNLAPTISIRGLGVSPASGVVQNFGDDITYTVTSKDSNTTKTYTVIVDYFNPEVPEVPVDNSVIRLTDCNGLQSINNNLDANYVLMNDIDCGPATLVEGILYNGGLGFEPIGKVSYSEYYEPDFSLSFKGNFDGNNFKIKNLKINRPSEEYVGLFSSTYEAVIKNVGLVDYNIFGSNCVGGLIGMGTGDKIINSYSDGDIQAGWGFGGLVGCANGGEYFRVYSLGNIKGWEYGGGLIGEAYLGDSLVYYGNGIVKDSYSSANVSGSNYVGGLLGGVDVYDSLYFELYNSYFKGEVNSTGSAVGGLFGYVTNGLIKNNYVNAIVNGGGGVGGLVGNSQNSSFENNYSTGSVSGNNLVGGLCGVFSNSSASNNFTTSKVISDKLTVGGLFGQVFNYSNGLGPLINNYFDEFLTGRSICYTVNSAGDYGYDGCNYSWDYNQQYFYKENAPLSSWTWKTGIVDGNWIVQEKNYPVLAWEKSSGYVDTVSPVVSLISPQNGDIVHKFSTTLKFNVYDSEKIGSCTINMGPSSYTWSNILSGDYEVTFPVEAKNYDWNVSCTDWVGNKSQLKSGSFSMVQNNYQITDCAGLQNMKNDLSGAYTLMKDIDCLETKTLNGGLGFEPIGTIQHCELSPEEINYIEENKIWSAYSNQSFCEHDDVGGIWHNDTNLFEGNFIANGKSITGLYINRPDFDGVGLFGITAPRVNLEGIKMTDFNIIGKYSVGSIVGESKSSSISNNYVTGEIFGRETAGGLTGRLSGSRVNNNEAYVKVIGQGTSVGGLIGVNEGEVSFVNNIVEGEVRAVAYVGGMIGYSYSRVSLVNNSFTGKVYGIGGTGGLIGKSGYYDSSNMVGNFVSVEMHKGSLTDVITEVYDPSIGGLAGHFNGFMKNNYVIGTIDGEDVTDVGGLVGIFGGTAVDNYSSVDVSGRERVGGLVGRLSMWDDQSFSNNFAVGSLNGTSSVGGLVGEMYDYSGSYYFGDNYYLNGSSCIGYQGSESELTCTQANYLEEFYEHYGSYHPVYYGAYAWDNNWVWSGYGLPTLNWQN